MVEIKTIIRKWGNSFGIIIPIDVLKRKNINEGEEIDVILIKKSNVLRESFGTHKFSKPINKLMKEVDKELYDI